MPKPKKPTREEIMDEITLTSNPRLSRYKKELKKFREDADKSPTKKSGRDLSDAIDKEANRPVRKSESGRYEGQDMSNLNAAGNDEDGEYLKKRK